jgi:hypothetical protein
MDIAPFEPCSSSLGRWPVAQRGVRSPFVRDTTKKTHSSDGYLIQPQVTGLTWMIYATGLPGSLIKSWGPGDAAAPGQAESMSSTN